MKSKIKLNRLYIAIVNVFIMQFILGITNLLPNHSVFNKIRGKMMSPFFGKCGSGFQLAKGAIINMPQNIFIGKNVYIAHNSWINGTGGLYIEDGVIISPNVVIATTKHLYKNFSVQLNESMSKKIVIGAGSWIASNSTITQGVNIGKGCVVAANSSVVKNTENYHLYAGVPAMKKKDLSDSND